MNEKKLSIVLPIYNEEKSIKKTILEWKNELDLLKIDYEIILAEDGSDDNTKNILFELINDDKNKIYLNNIVEKKRGYGGAIISSVKIANGEFILYVDADGQCNPKDFINFWNKKEFIGDGIIIGNRKTRADTLFRLIMSKSFKIIHRILFYSKVKDPSCPYVLCRKKTFLELEKYLIYMV
jgi:glycosyltransferase involved in cell wall biosynthesis